jgi:catechol 2,3-dioxygenase-like lactoylglutathione lyase family enzyme
MTGLVHLNLNVSDIVRSERFYVEALGFIRIADTSDDVEYRGRRFFLKQIVLGRPDAHDLLALSEAEGAPVGGGGMNHFGVVVPDAEVEQLVARVELFGGKVVKAGRRSHGGVDEAFAYVQDPDGYDLELCSQRIVYATDPRHRR